MSTAFDVKIINVDGEKVFHKTYFDELKAQRKLVEKLNKQMVISHGKIMKLTDGKEPKLLVEKYGDWICKVE
jgi:hypothetical protein